MIRIDLGNDDNRGGTKTNIVAGVLSKLKFGRGGGSIPAYVERPRRSIFASIGELGATIILVASIAGAYVPHFFFEQYKQYILDEHEASKKQLEEKVSLISKEVAKLTPFQKELESYEGQKKIVQERIQIIRSLLNQRGTPVNVLDAVAQSLPPRGWLNNIELDARKGGGSVNLSGQSFSNEDISDYVDKLSESVYLQEVTLENVGMTKGLNGQADVKTFQVAIIPKGMRIAAPAPAESKPAEPARDTTSGTPAPAKAAGKRGAK